MKLITSTTSIIVLILISFVFCETENLFESENKLESVDGAVAFSTLQRFCRSGYQLDGSGRCRKVLGSGTKLTTTTTAAP